MPLHRRDFVECALGLAATALAGVDPRADAPSSRPQAGSGERLRVAIVGVNGRGKSHVAAWLAQPDADLVTICDCDPGAFVRLCEKGFDRSRRVPDFTTDFRRLLDRKDIDVVSIATPNHWHALMAVWAMQAGKDVYLEKPCSYTVEEGRVITQWARKLGRICQMGAQSRSMTGMRQTIDFVKSGQVGPVKVAHALCYKRRKSIGLVDKPAPVPPGMNFDVWAGPAPAVVPTREKLHYDWHWDHVTGNGDLGNQNPHELDKGRWGLGKQELPQRVVSIGGRLGYVDNGDVANSQITLFQWDDALLISDVRGLEIKSSLELFPQTTPLRIANIWWGTEGFVVAPSYASGAAFTYDGKELGTWSGGSEQAHFANFAAAVKSRRHEDLHLDIEDGHLSSALAHLGNVSWTLGQPVDPGTRPTLAADDKRVRATFESFETHLRENAVDFAKTPLKLGRELAIDPATEKAADPEANRLFTREYRAGYELPRV
jgi:hypothetical protein